MLPTNYTLCEHNYKQHGVEVSQIYEKN